MTTSRDFTFRVCLPWWWRPYLWVLLAFAASGGHVDVAVAKRFLARHTRVKVVEDDYRRK